MTKVKTRITAIALVVLFLLCAVALSISLSGGTAYADDTKTYADYYYGSQLENPLARTIYNELLAMDKTSGQNHRINDPDIIAEAQKYAKGDKTLTEQFDAAVSSFYYDHTEYFWINPKALTLSVNKDSDGYFVTLGGGRSGNYFISGVTPQNLSAKINDYNTRLDAMVEGIQSEIERRGITESGSGSMTYTYINALLANDAVVKSVEYSFCADSNGVENAMAPYIRTAYGALVNGKAVCEGYSRLFKAVMNKLGFDCVLVSGAAAGEDGVEPHMWNAVFDKTKEEWYGVDSTWNDVTDFKTEASGVQVGDYLMISGTVLGFDHFENPVISDVGYALTYPKLHEDVYKSSSGKLEAFYTLATFKGTANQKCIAIRYMGQNHIGAKAEGNYIAYRFIDNGNPGEWFSFDSISKTGDFSGFVDNDSTYSYFKFSGNTNLNSVEFAVFDAADDKPGQPLYNFPHGYTEEHAKAHLIDELVEGVPNPSFNPTYVSPSYIKSIVATQKDANEHGNRYSTTKWQQQKQDIAIGTMHIRVVYVQKLEKVDSSKEIGIECTPTLQTGDNRTIDMDEIFEYASIENFTFDLETSTAEFYFTPSPMYQHNNIFYTFSLTNLQSDSSKLGALQDPVAPISFSAAYAYADTYVCTKCLGGGRYLIDNAYSSPVLVSDGDLSTEGWTYTKDGVEHKVSESQRSNLALVVTKPVGAVEQASKQGAEEQIEKLHLPATSEVSSTTYEVDLNICGKIVSIPNGSYLKINLGYPYGIKYDELDGVVFKLYHFKRGVDGELDYTHPEEIECIITPYGLIATVTSFSPYTLVTIKNAPDSLVQEQDAKKGITTDFDGSNGKLTSSTGKLTETLTEGDEITYTLTPNSGYVVEYALLNGKAVPVTDNKVKISYADLAHSNIFSCGFVAQAVQTREIESGVFDVHILNVVNEKLALSGEDEVEDVTMSVNGATTTVGQDGIEYTAPVGPPLGLLDEITNPMTAGQITLSVVFALTLALIVIGIPTAAILTSRRPK